MFEDDSIFCQCLEQPLNSGWQIENEACVLRFSLSPYTRADARPFLILEGAPSPAKISLNGMDIGEVQPYYAYRFEITGLLRRDQENELLLSFPAGMPCRPPQNAYIDYKKANVILQADLTYQLDERMNAECNLRISADLKDPRLNLQVFLLSPKGDIILDRNIPAEAEMHLSFSVSSPSLWSPQDPLLYSLNLSLEKNGMLFDMYSHGKSGKIGFKKIEKRDEGLFLNQVPFLPKTVHLPPNLSQIDLMALKSNGTNLILCPVPSTDLLEAADEQGILIASSIPPEASALLPFWHHVSFLPLS